MQNMNMGAYANAEHPAFLYFINEFRFFNFSEIKIINMIFLEKNKCNFCCKILIKNLEETKLMWYNIYKIIPASGMSEVLF